MRHGPGGLAAGVLAARRRRRDLYGVQDTDWRPAGPAFLLAVAVVVPLEFGRAVYARTADETA